MNNAHVRLDQALKDLVEAYVEIDEELRSKFSGDVDSFANAIIETLETSLESSVEEHDVSTNALAAMFSNLTEALEQLDPSAFDDDEEQFISDEVAGDIEDIDLDEEEDEEIEGVEH